jgi:four helix bundle protein
MSKHSYQDLRAWQLGMDVARAIHIVTRDFPKNELYGITAQLRRASVSIPSNIAEGQGRAHRREFEHFLSHARGSLYEVETQLRLSRDFEYLHASDYDKLTSLTRELGRVLNGLINAVYEQIASEQMDW